MARLPELHDRMAAVLAAVVAERDGAAARHDAARAARAEVEAAVQRWEQWQRDVAEVRAHPAEVAADAEVAVALERAVVVATLATSVEAWRAATRRLGALDAERLQLRAAVDAGWVDGADRSALESATTAHLLSATIAAEAAALEAADRRFVELGRRLATLEEDERDLLARTTALARATVERDDLAERLAAAEAAVADGAARTVERPAAVDRIEQLERAASAVRERAAAARQLAGLVDDQTARRATGWRTPRHGSRRCASPGGRDWPAGWPPTSRTGHRARPVAPPSIRRPPCRRPTHPVTTSWRGPRRPWGTAPGPSTTSTSEWPRHGPGWTPFPPWPVRTMSRSVWPWHVPTSRRSTRRSPGSPPAGWRSTGSAPRRRPSPPISMPSAPRSTVCRER